MPVLGLPTAAAQGTTWHPYEGLIYSPFLQGYVHVQAVSIGGWYTNQVALSSPQNNFAFTCAVGASATLGPYLTVGEVEFMVYVDNEGAAYWSGSTSPLSADGLDHFQIYQDANDPWHFQFQFEDQYFLGDGDFNDCVFEAWIYPGL